MWLKVIPWAACVILSGLLLKAHQDIGAQIGECNASKLAAVAAAEKKVREAEKQASERKLAQLARQTESERRAREIADEGRIMAEAGTAEREDRIRELELEADFDDIPDSAECLNVFIRAVALDGLLHAGDCTGAVRGEGGDDQVCTNTRRVPGGDPGFSNITYGDGLILWGRDRDIIDVHNADKRAIKSISDEVAP